MSSRPRSPAAYWVAGAAVFLLIAVVAGAPPGDGAPLDPTSTSPTGTRALVLLLGGLGAEVTITGQSPAPSDDIALLLQDRLRDEDRAPLLAWVRAGGTLVVTDPTSPMVPAIAGGAGTDIGFGASSITRGRCDIAALADVARLDPNGGVDFRPPQGSARCFADDTSAFVVSVGLGSGTVVSVGGGDVFANDVLGSFDNSVLAASLLAPSEGTRVAVLQPPAIGSGTTSLSDLIAKRVKQAILQLGVAFVVYALWRARRLGRPVAEPQPVQLAGSELVAAVGNLLQQSRTPDRAAATLRRDLRRELGDRLGVPLTAPPEALAHAAAARTGADRDKVLAALAGPPVTTEAELVLVAQSIESIRQEVLHGQPA